MLKDFISLLFPDLCAACGQSLNHDEEIICIVCEYKLPLTNYHLQEDHNALEKIFYGRVHLTFASAMYLFNKEGLVQSIIHNFKYKGNKHIGEFLGMRYGYELKKNNKLSDVDLVIPVPLHWKKLKERTFNQSEYFAKGIAQSMDVKMISDIIIRREYTTSQTNKSRFERWQNVTNAFETNANKCINYKHLLLVDDVITTGSTIEACVNTLIDNNNRGMKISVAAIAHATM